MAPNSPSASPLSPSEKYRTSGLPLLPPTPKRIVQRPPAFCPPVSIGIVPCNFPLLGIKALISLWRKLKLLTSTSLLNRRKPGGAMVIPQGAARRLPETSSRMKLPSSSKTATAPAPKGAAIWAETERHEIAVEDIDAAERGIGGVKARLCAVDRQPRVRGPGDSGVLDKGRRAGVPSRNCSVQIGEDEVRKFAVSTM